METKWYMCLLPLKINITTIGFTMLYLKCQLKHGSKEMIWLFFQTKVKLSENAELNLPFQMSNTELCTEN